MATPGPRKQAKTEETTPEGIIYNRPPHRNYPAACIRHVDRGTPHTSTFEVVPEHNKIDGLDGVSFSVETVPNALEEHLKKPTKSRQDFISSIRNTASGMKIEALCDTSGKRIVHVGANGFVMALVTAFAQHLPLTLSPDDIWVVLSYAFAQHVDKNAEALRKDFVGHEGKKRLFVETPSCFAMADGDNPDTGASTEEWESLIFPRFSSQIKDHVGSKTHEAIAGSFSTTTPTVKAAHEITLMSAMKNYFSFGMRTCCGIPNVTLLGTEQDWATLRSRAEHLGTLMVPEFSQYWMQLLLPILDEFVQSYKGNVNHSFWQSMVKLRHTGGGSGSYSFISGWMQILFPYLTHGRLATGLRPWQEMYFHGPEMDDFPLLLSFAPVDWEYYGTTFDIKFNAGVLGVTQDENTGALSPLLGWYVSHAEPLSAQEQLKLYKKESNDLLLGHIEEAAAGKVDKSAPWYRRVQFLKKKLDDLEG